MSIRVDRPRARLRLWLNVAALVALVIACASLAYRNRDFGRSYGYLSRLYNWELGQARGPLKHLDYFGPFDDEVAATVDRVNRLVSPELRLDSAIGRGWVHVPVFTSQPRSFALNPRLTCRGPLDDRFVLDSALGGTIVLCQETLELAFALAWNERTLADAEDRLWHMRRVMDFILAHELAHALLQSLAVPFTGPPEEAADELGTILLVESDHFAPDDVQAVISFLGELSEAQSVPDEIRSAHGMTRQRAERIKCIGIGYQSYARMPVSPSPLDSGFNKWNTDTWGSTPDQMQRCVSEYAPLRERWKQALKGFWLGREGQLYSPSPP